MIIEHIISFLQFDIASLFKSTASKGNCCLCQTKCATPLFHKAEQKCIEHKYPPRPQITNGEDDFIRILEDYDSSPETMDAATPDGCEADDEAEPCGETEQEDDDNDADDDANNAPDGCTTQQSPCEVVCRKIVTKIAEKCSSATLSELKTIEERAYKLWTTLNTNATRNECSPNWWKLKSWQKLPFYWAALSNEILNEDPFENFKSFFVGSRKCTKRSAKKQNERTLIVWHSLNTKQRLPFVMEAFISKVSAGKVNLSDEREIQRVIGELQKD